MRKNPDIHLHIISFDVPYPANYGGVIDVFYKAKALADSGVRVHLHCFEEGQEKAQEMEKLFYDVRYYKHDMSKKHLFKKNPFIVETRISEELIQNLLLDNYPILMEGLHTTGLLREKRLKHRKRIVRTHNIEHEYYRNLSRVETDWIKKIYFFIEAVKLKNYEPILHKADHLLTISKTDQDYFSSKYNSAVYMPAFHPHTTVKSRSGKGEYVLYHGNLAIAENISAVTILINQVFSGLKIPFKIAGLNPPSSLWRSVADKPFVEIIANPDDYQLNNLIRNAHANVLYTDQATGLKLKLLNALYNGRFVLANDKMLSGSNMEKLCIVANSPYEMQIQLTELMKKDFTSTMMKNRQMHLQNIYMHRKNVERLIELIV